MRLNEVLKLNKSVIWTKTVHRHEPVLSQYFFCKGMAKRYHKELCGIDFEFKYRRYINYQVYTRKRDMNELKKIVLKRYKNDANYFNYIANKIKKVTKNLLDFSLKVKQKNYTFISRKKIISDFKDYIGYSLKQIPTFNIVLAVTYALEYLLKKNLPSNIQLSELFEKILTAGERTDNNINEGQAINKIVQYIRQKNIKEWKNNSFVKKMVRSYLKKYAWMSTSYFIGDPWTVGDINKRIEILLQSSTIQKKSKTQIDRFNKKIQKLSPQIQTLINLVQKYIKLRMYRTDAMHIADCNIRNLHHAMAKILGINRDLLIFATHDEIISALEGKHPIDANELKKRENNYVMLMINSKIYLFSGNNALFFFPKIKKNKRTHIKGLIACKGLVSGQAKIMKSSDDNEKIEKGDIIITQMTTPDFIPAMEKASAFVTDEGGITCHAAIIAREMNKPCIIGTKNATEIFSDGDSIEVDANKGVIRKI